MRRVQALAEAAPPRGAVRREPAAASPSEALGGLAETYREAYGDPAAQELATEAPVRLGVGLRTAVVGTVAVLLVAAVVVGLAWSRAHAVVPLPEVRPAATAAASAAPGGQAEPQPGAQGGEQTAAQPTAQAEEAAAGVVVHVVGEVRRPGLVTLPAGARVADAVEAAGGPTDDAELSGVNLARVLVDGEQLRVPAPGEVLEPPDGTAGATGVTGTTGDEGVAEPPGAAGATGSAGGTVDVNTADAATLETLPGVGPVLAQRIVDHRTEHGAFASVDDLEDVSGIGPAVLAGLRDRVST